MSHKRMEEAIQAATISAEAAKTEAEQASEAKDHFLALLSHELRTPLTPVVAALSILQHQPGLDAQTREYLEMIRRNIELEIRLIDDLLDVTRINRGKIAIERKPVEVSAILGRAVEICRGDIEARRITFSVDIKQQPHVVQGDPVRLQQMFWNLIKNAIKFTPVGGKVQVAASRENGDVLVQVSDNGVGIEADALSKIFNAFEQVDRSITRQFGGLGLGLTISKAMAELHDGSIEAHSDGRNRGATFKVRLPIVNAAVTSPAPDHAGVKPPASPTFKILLIEDHHDSAEMLRLLLTRQGYEVQTAANMTAGLDAAKNNTFDVIVSDLSLPDGSGTDLMRRLRAAGHLIPGIALSGYGQEQDVRKSLQAGFAAHLIKPVNIDQINKTILTVVHRSVAPRVD